MFQMVTNVCPWITSRLFKRNCCQALQARAQSATAAVMAAAAYELQRVVHGVDVADAVEVTGRQRAQDRHGAPEA